MKKNEIIEVLGHPFEFPPVTVKYYSGLTVRQERKHKETRKRKGRKL